MSIQSMRQEVSSTRKSDAATMPTEVTAQNIPDIESQKILVVSTKKQNFFIDSEEINSGVRGLRTADKTPTSGQLSDMRITPMIKSRLISQGRDDRYDTPDEIAIRDENNDDISPMPKSTKNFRDALSEKFRRQDSTPYVIRDFDQIDMDDGKTEGGPQFDYSPLSSPERSSAGFNSVSASTFITSKFAPDHFRRSSQNNNFIIKPQKTDTPMDLRDSTTLRDSIDGFDAKKKWSKLSYVFQSMLLFKREEVKSITDPDSISNEINKFELRTALDKPNRNYDISRQDFARDAFQSIRRVQIFCECATIGSRKHQELMKELIQKDPKRYILEPDDPSFILNHKNSFGHTPLYIAAKNGNAAIVELLIASHADFMITSQIDAQNLELELPLQVAVRWNHANVVDYLLTHCPHDKKLVRQCLELAQNHSVKSVLNRHLNRMSGKQRWRSIVKCFG